VTVWHAYDKDERAAIEDFLARNGGVTGAEIDLPGDDALDAFARTDGLIGHGNRFFLGEALPPGGVNCCRKRGSGAANARRVALLRLDHAAMDKSEQD